MGASASAGLQNSFVAQSSPSLLSPQYSHRGTRYCLPSSSASPLCIRACIVSPKITFPHLLPLFIADRFPQDHFLPLLTAHQFPQDHFPSSTASLHSTLVPPRSLSPIHCISSYIAHWFPQDHFPLSTASLHSTSVHSKSLSIHCLVACVHLLFYQFTFHGLIVWPWEDLVYHD